MKNLVKYDSLFHIQVTKAVQNQVRPQWTNYVTEFQD